MTDTLSQIVQEWARLNDVVAVVYVDKAGARLKAVEAAGADLVRIDAVDTPHFGLTSLRLGQFNTQLGLTSSWIEDFNLSQDGYLSAGRRFRVVVLDVAGQPGKTQGYAALLPLAVDVKRREAWPLRGDPLTRRQRWWLKLSRFFTHDRS